MDGARAGTDGRTPAPAGADDPIAALLGRLDRRVRRTGSLDGLARCCLALHILICLWLAADAWLLPAFGAPRPAHVALNVSLALALAIAAWRWLPRRRRGAVELALLVEQAHPALAGRLVSAVQLARDPGPASPALLAAQAGQARALAAAIDHRSAWDARPAQRLALLALLALLAAAALSARDPAGAATMLRRLAGEDAPWPTASRIAAVRLPSPAAQGEPATVVIELDPAARLPATVELAVRDAALRESSLTCLASGDGTWHGILPAALPGLMVRPRAGDHRWPRWEPLAVAQRPAIAGVELRIEPPAYLGGGASAGTVPDLAVPEGSRVAAAIAFSRPIARAELVQDGRRSPLALSPDGRRSEGALLVAADGWWSVAAWSADGLDLAPAPRWTLHALPDRAPVVTVASPDGALLAGAGSAWVLCAEATDDHGLGAVRLRTQVIPPGADPSAPGTPVIERPVAVAAGARAVTVRETLDIAALAAPAGSRVAWWFEASDRREPSPNLGVGRRGLIEVLDDDELVRRLARERAEIGAMLEALIGRQRAVPPEGP